MEDLWGIFCGQSNCSSSRNTTEPCSPDFVLITHPASCVNHMLLICFDLLLLAIFLVNLVHRISSKKIELPACSRPNSALQISSAVYNGCLGVVYIGISFWILEGKLRNDHSVLPIHRWIVLFFHGFTWLLVGLTVSLKGAYFPSAPLRILSISAFLFAGISCFLAVYAVMVHKETTAKVVLDILSFIGASLLLLCTYKGYRCNESEESTDGSTLYTPLNGEADGSSQVGSAAEVTPFAKAGLFSKMSFWWLNPLMKLGRRKTLGEEDIPKLGDAETAESCYLQFMDQLNNRKQDETSFDSSVLWTIVTCHKREILISGFFALLKIVTLSAGPLLLNAFIKVAEGKEAFRYEGYVLSTSLFIAKTLESLSQRQWYFRCRLIGLKVRSLLTAAIYRKQLRLSNEARMMHSGGEIMNYVTVDAYRIGEFPFWFHQTWTTSLQLCIALGILFHAVAEKVNCR